MTSVHLWNKIWYLVAVCGCPGTCSKWKATELAWSVVSYWMILLVCGEGWVCVILLYSSLAIWGKHIIFSVNLFYYSNGYTTCITLSITLFLRVSLVVIIATCSSFKECMVKLWYFYFVVVELLPSKSFPHSSSDSDWCRWGRYGPCRLTRLTNTR